MSLNGCGPSYATEDDAACSKRALSGVATPKLCRLTAGHWHLEAVRKPRAPKPRTSRIKPRSDKTVRKYQIRGPLVATLLAERPWCEIRWDAKCWKRATQVHEPGMRSRGADICDPEQCVTGCAYCHRQVHGNPAEATKRGWLIPSGVGRCAA